MIKKDIKKSKRLTKKMIGNAVSRSSVFSRKIIFDHSFRKNLYSKTKQKIHHSAKTILDQTFEEEGRNIAHKPITLGIWFSVGLVGVFLLWSITARIDSSAIAMGKVVLDSDKKTIQHFEGGIIEEIFVEDGQKVRAGQPLIKLNETAARANQELVKKQLFALKAAKIRLESERDNKDLPDFSTIHFQYKDDVDFIKIIDGEKSLFLTRKRAIDEKVSILQQKINQLNNEIIAIKSQEKSVRQRIAFAHEEANALDELYEQGIISRSRYLELKKQMAELQGNQGEYVANIAKVRQAINESELEIANVKTEKMNEIVKELQETQTKIADLEERVFASSDILQRTIIRAPQNGIVNGLKFHTKGGVIAQGGEIMEIVPQDDELIVEVKINPQDIDVVSVGLKSKVRLAAYKSKAVPMLDGKVINISADSFLEQNTGASYFLGRIKIGEKEMKKLENVKLYPGMPVEAHIVTGSRTFMRYLFDPITISTKKAFREE
ncbi:MAG: HlyD family type I secretion periplasmic adaptor subunit [Proteobacteria bacterium]|nr:HlyD family type I secretion periplasmic adaptor subunit [Pseudomonadota bacterium]